MSPWIRRTRETLSDGEGKGRLAELCLAALLTCAALGCALFITLRSTAGHSPDAEHYIDMARRLVTEGTYSFWGQGPDAYTTPGYPLFLAGCMAFFGTGESGILAARLIQCLLAAALVPLTHLLARELTGKPGVGLGAALLVAANTTYYYYSQRLLTETLYFFFMMLFFLLFARARRLGGWGRQALAGAVLAGAVLVRPLIVILLPFLYLPHLWRSRKAPKEAWAPVGFFLLGFAAVCLPWWIRNGVTLGRFIPLATQTNPIYAGLAPDPAALGLEDPGSLGGNIALLLRLLREHFVSTVNWMTLGKFKLIFQDDFPYRPVAFTALVKDLTVYLGLAGSVAALFTRKGRWPAVLFWIYLASSFLFVPAQRYALQYLPLLAIFGVWLLERAFSAVRGQPESSQYTA